MFKDELLMLQKYFQDKLKKEFIKSSSFSVVASMIFVKKLDEDFRFCVDCRDLNAISLKNRYSLLLFRETLDRLSSVKYYFKIDIIVAFNRLRIVFDEKYKIAFRTRYDLYEYLVMSFELVNVSFIWQHFINDILRDKLDVFCIVYLDDILIYSNIKKQHDEHVRWVLKQLRKIDIQTNIKKCEFDVQKIKYLNLIITIDDIRMNFEKIKVILKWETLNCVKDVQSFLDFDNFYHRFIRVFNKLVESLTEFIKKNLSFKWIKKCEKVFQTLKAVFAKESILRHYDLENECQVECNVFDRMIDDVLSQKNKNDTWRFVIYFFNKMILAECNYEIYDKKLLIIVRVFEKWRFELEDFKFFIEVILDHKNLKYFMFFKLFNRCQVRWFEFLSRFNFRIIYRLDKFNSVVDALSRRSKDFSKKRKNKFMWQQILKNENFEIFVLSIQTFNSNRAFILEIVEFVFDLFESIISKFITIESILSNRIIIFDVDNSVLMLEEIVKVARATTRANVEQVVADISKLENQNLEDQFKIACNNDARYQRVVKTIRNNHS